MWNLNFSSYQFEVVVLYLESSCCINSRGIFPGFFFMENNYFIKLNGINSLVEENNSVKTTLKRR